eukprot:scaffold38878_cov15-Prasinocladus_malaysianus.AAC.1
MAGCIWTSFICFDRSLLTECYMARRQLDGGRSEPTGRQRPVGVGERSSTLQVSPPRAKVRRASDGSTAAVMRAPSISIIWLAMSTCCVV